MTLFDIFRKPNKETSPVPLNPAGSSPKPSNNGKKNEAESLIKTIAGTSISGSGARLVLGEQDAAIQDALNNGGKFILVHPEVARQLQQAGLDPYIVSITALIQEMEAQIPRIDFVNADMAGLEHEWRDKPKDRVPVHVRQMLWLQSNAEKFGYQQSGNSWKLKPY